MPRIRRMLWTIGVGLLLAGGLLYGCQRRVLFPGGGAVPATPLAARLPGAISMDVLHEDGRSEGVLRLGAGVSAAAPGPVVVMAHGNGETIDLWVEALEPYRRAGVSVALLEYRGYGRSDGAPSEAGLLIDFTAFVDALLARPEVDAARLVYHGRSLGGGVLGALTAARPPRALVLESTFCSVTRLAWERLWAPAFLVRDPFDTEAALGDFAGPVLVLHGSEDRVVPLSHGRALAARARSGRLVVRACGHNDCPPDARWWAEILKTLAEAGIL